MDFSEASVRMYNAQMSGQPMFAGGARETAVEEIRRFLKLIFEIDPAPVSIAGLQEMAVAASHGDHASLAKLKERHPEFADIMPMIQTTPGRMPGKVSDIFEQINKKADAAYDPYDYTDFRQDDGPPRQLMHQKSESIPVNENPDAPDCIVPPSKSEAQRNREIRLREQALEAHETLMQQKGVVSRQPKKMLNVAPVPVRGVENKTTRMLTEVPHEMPAPGPQDVQHARRQTLIETTPKKEFAPEFKPNVVHQVPETPNVLFEVMPRHGKSGTAIRKDMDAVQRAIDVAGIPTLGTFGNSAPTWTIYGPDNDEYIDDDKEKDVSEDDDINDAGAKPKRPARMLTESL